MYESHQISLAVQIIGFVLAITCSLVIGKRNRAITVAALIFLVTGFLSEFVFGDGAGALFVIVIAPLVGGVVARVSLAIKHRIIEGYQK